MDQRQGHLATEAETGVMCVQTKDTNSCWPPAEAGREAGSRFPLRARGDQPVHLHRDSWPRRWEGTQPVVLSRQFVVTCGSSRTPSAYMSLSHTHATKNILASTKTLL